MQDLDYTIEVGCKKTRTIIRRAAKELCRNNTPVGDRVYSRIIGYTKYNDEIEKTFKVTEGNKLFKVWFRLEILNVNRMKFSIKIKQLDRNWKHLG